MDNAKSNITHPWFILTFDAGFETGFCYWFRLILVLHQIWLLVPVMSHGLVNETSLCRGSTCE